MNDFKRQIVVIGGGAGGLSIASVLSRLGYKVTLVEKNSTLGGDCLHYGCVPSKAFITAAKVAYTAHNTKQFGIHCDVKVDFKKVQEYVKSIVENIQKHDDPIRFKSYGVEVMFGNAHFVGEHMLSVDNKLIPAEKFIIATGSSPKIPEIEGLNKVKYYTNENILDIEQQPKKLIILGGGPIGLEYAQAFARLGTKVIILESAPELMPTLDRQQFAVLTDSLHKQGVDFYDNVNIKKISKQEGISIDIEIRDDLDNSNVVNNETITGDALLIATGRKPSIDSLGLELIGIEYNHNGIVVDDYLRTSRKHIYAVGDVVDTPFKFTHIAEYHAGIVIRNLAYKLFPKKTNYNIVPRVTYTDPEWAQVGLTERMANDRNIHHQVVYYPLAGLDRAVISGHTSGSIKLIIKRNKLLGASILSPHAGELIHELALAMQHNLSLKDITETIHAYPTWAQMHRRAINRHFEPVLFGGFSRFIVRLMQLMG